MAWELDSNHTNIGFSAKYMMVTTVKGSFTKYSSEIDLDEANPTNSSFNVTIETNSIDSRTEMRDNHLRSPDFFDVASYPTMTYKSKKIEKLGDDHYQILGDLTIRDVTREVPLDVTYEGEGKNPYGRRIAGFTATGSINRKDFGLNWNVALETGGWLVGDRIQLNIDAQLIEKVEAPANA